MAITNDRTLWGPLSIGGVSAYSTALAAVNLTDADNAAVWTFNVPTSGTITDIGFYCSTKTGSPPNYNAAIVALDSSGRPTTTPYGSSAVTEFAPPSAGWTWITLGTPATATAGDFAAVYIYPSASAPSLSNYIGVVYGDVADLGGSAGFYTTIWTLGYNQRTSLLAVRYSTGAVYGLAMTSNSPFVQIRSNTTPDEIGNRFVLPAAMTVTGARFVAAYSVWGSAAAADVIVYDGNNNVVVSTTIADKDYVDDGNCVNVFWSPTSLAANTTYRLVVKPTVATNGDIYVQKWSFESAAALAAIPCGNGSWRYTSRSDGGAWTDDSLSICPMALWCSGIDFAGGAVKTIFVGGPYGAEFPASNFPQLTIVNRHPALAFDASTDETAYWTFVAPAGLSGTITCVISYMMASATSGSIYWQAALEAVTAGDATDLDATTSFDTANSGNGTVPATAGYMAQISITMTNADSISPGDLVRLSINRDADNASDTATGDAYLLSVELRN